MGDASKCELCGEPMPTGEEMFKFHGYSGPCPKPPLPPQREAEPHDDDVECQRIEIEFAIPVFIPQAALRELDGLLSSIVRLKTNQLKGHAHWVSGYGSKPLWSQADARFLGKTPADDAPAIGEPSFDDSVYHIETSCIARRGDGR
jgi:hypothetical protein